jgi:hypothetical protein
VHGRTTRRAVQSKLGTRRAGGSSTSLRRSAASAPAWPRPGRVPCPWPACAALQQPPPPRLRSRIRGPARRSPRPWPTLRRACRVLRLHPAPWPMSRAAPPPAPRSDGRHPRSPQPWRKTKNVRGSWLSFFLSWLTSQTRQLELANVPSRARLLTRYDNELTSQLEFSRAGSISSLTSASLVV